MATTFADWFATISGHASTRSWQRELADEAVFRDRLIRIPTGLGKTEGALAAWSFHRIFRADEWFTLSRTPGNPECG